MNYSYYNTLQKLCYKITELQAYFAFILLNLLSNQLAAKRGQERPATLILTVISGFPIMRARHVYNRDLETRNSNFALQLRTIRMRKKVSIITVCHMASKLLSHGSEDVFLLTLLRRAWRTLNVLTLLRRATRTSRTSSVTGFAAGYFLRCVSMSVSWTRFSKCSVSGSPNFVDVELIQIEKNELSCGMFFLDH